MKTKVFFATVILISIATFAQASSPKRILTFNSANGKVLTRPVKDEVARDEAFPFELQAAVQQTSKESIGSSPNLDIRHLIKPEPEVNDVPEELKNLINR